MIRCVTSAMVTDAPIFGSVAITDNTFKIAVVYLCWSCCKFRKGGDSISNVKAAADIGIHQFSKNCAIRETHFLFKLKVFFGTFCGTTSARAKK